MCRMGFGRGLGGVIGGGGGEMGNGEGRGGVDDEYVGPCFHPILSRSHFSLSKNNHPFELSLMLRALHRHLPLL